MGRRRQNASPDKLHQLQGMASQPTQGTAGQPPQGTPMDSFMAEIERLPLANKHDGTVRTLDFNSVQPDYFENLDPQDILHADNPGFFDSLLDDSVSHLSATPPTAAGPSRPSAAAGPADAVYSADPSAAAPSVAPAAAAAPSRSSQRQVPPLDDESEYHVFPSATPLHAQVNEILTLQRNLQRELLLNPKGAFVPRPRSIFCLRRPVLAPPCACAALC
jgi:hypothetical protein